MTILCRLGFKCVYQPRDNHLFEYDGIGPDLHLTSEVATLRVDPGYFRNVPFTEEQVNVGDRDLCVKHSSYHQHGCDRLSQQALFDKRHLRQSFRHFVHSFHVVENCHECWHLVEQIFTVAQERVHQEVLLEEDI